MEPPAEHMMKIRILVAAALAVAATGLRPTDGRALDIDGWVDLVQMPVAVARLDVAGIPLADLRLLVPALNTRDVEPSLFLETVRGLPVLWGDDERVRDGGEGMGPYVQAMHARGLRGRELAEAIHSELRRRGVPAGPKRGRGHDVLARDYVPDRFVDPRFRDDDRFGLDEDDGRPGRARGRLFGTRGRDGIDAPGRGPSMRGGDDRSGPGARGQGQGRGGPPAARGKGNRPGNPPARGKAPRPGGAR